MASITYRPLTRGILRPDDQALYADFQQDCEAKRRWHRVYYTYVGYDVAKLCRRFKRIKFRRRA